jgi:hypothetical protein
MFNKGTVLAVVLTLTATAANAASVVLDSRASNIEVSYIAVKSVATKVERKEDPNCKWPDGPLCSDTDVVVERANVVEVLVDYSTSTFPNNEDGVDSAEVRLPLSAFTADELAKIKSVSGYKAQALARRLVKAVSKNVKLPVREAVYGNCDSEQNCEVVGYETVQRTFKEVTVSRK